MVRLSYASVLIPVAVGTASGSWVSVSAWGDLRSNFLPALSVIAAGVLVRLARGIPFSNLDQFEVEEARRVSAAFVQVVRSLRALMYATLAAMLWLAVAPDLAQQLDPVISKMGFARFLNPTLSATIGLVVAFAITRMVEVIQGDVSLAILQQSLLVKAAERRAAAAFQTTISSDPTSPIAGQSRFGKPLV
jgi:hypothetical protein